MIIFFEQVWGLNFNMNKKSYAICDTSSSILTVNDDMKFDQPYEYL